MPEISLQAYEQEIDELIEQARYVEALAHLRHILSQYPRYLDAYYLLGKTMLEADLPEVAIDVFRRALTADPEHLMSRIGLGLAHERRGNLNAAIWNLERALELDPGNADIADELRRLVGRRDGIEPEHIPQTRAGLARLYLRANRSGRAADELRQVLDDSPARPDLMTALAEAYWRDEQLVQASDACQEILDKMPYNCKANLLLGTLWLNSGQEEGQRYLSRAQELDPQNEIAQALFGSASLLEPREAELERLSYDPDGLAVDRESTWFRRLEAASVTVGISEAPPEMTEDEVRLADITAGLESQIEIPDWLRELGGPEGEEEGELGWMEAIEFEETEEPTETGVAEEEVSAVETGGLEEAYETEVGLEALEGLDETAAPDWLQELSVEGTELELREEEGETADWLQELVSDAEPAVEEMPPETVEFEEAVSEEEAPDWLSELETEQRVEEGAEEIPDWLAELEPTIPEGDEEIALSEEGMPPWLVELEGAPRETAEAQETVVKTPSEELEELPAEAEEVAEEEIPDWLAEFPTEESAGVAEAVGEEVPDWLRELGPSEEVSPEVVEEATVIEEAPGPQEEVPEEPVSYAEAESLAPEVPAEALGAPTGEEVLSGDDALAWLESLAVGKEEELRAQAEAESEERVAEILGRKPRKAPEAAPEAAPEEEITEAPEPEDFEAAEAVLETPAEMREEMPAGEEMVSDDDALAWLESLAAAEEPSATQPPTAEEEIEGEVSTLEEQMQSDKDALAWLESLAVGEEEQRPVEAEAELEERLAEIPAAELRELEQEEEPAETPEPADTVETLETEAPVTPESAVREPLEPEPAAEEPAAEMPAAEMPADEMLSGDDAVAWLESLTAGKEEELRARAEAESEERVAEILGRKPQKSEPKEEVAEAPEVEIGESEGPEEVEPSQVVTAETELLTPEVGGAEEERPSEDALAWLDNLSEEEEVALLTELEAEPALEETSAEPPSEEEVPSPPVESAEEETRFFGWSAFGEDIAEVGEPAAISAGQEEEPAAPEPEPQEEMAAVAEPAQEPAPEPVEEPEPEAATIEEVEEAVAPEEPAPEPVEEPEPEAATIEEVGEPAAPEEPEAPEAEQAPEPETAVEAEGEAAKTALPSAQELDDMRAHVKKKRSDDAARLSLARALWDVGEIQESMGHYARLIKTSAKTEEVMEDLMRYRDERPTEPSVLRTLGDLYMKDGDLQKALEAYNRAMDLL
ncbi:MAG: tetratricopeptide repeat protein [Anaerolineae bacterium]